MYYDTLNQCSNLKDIVFTCKQPPNLTVYPGYQMVYPFRFNSYDWNDDATELAHLHITVPQGAEDDYMTAWRYPMQATRLWAIICLSGDVGHDL